MIEFLIKPFQRPLQSPWGCEQCWNSAEGVLLAKQHSARLHIFLCSGSPVKRIGALDPKLKEIIEGIRRKFEGEVKPVLNGFDNVTFR